jgi:hypothetical protein
MKFIQLCWFVCSSCKQVCVSEGAPQPGSMVIKTSTILMVRRCHPQSDIVIDGSRIARRTGIRLQRTT